MYIAAWGLELASDILHICGEHKAEWIVDRVADGIGYIPMPL